MGQVRRWHPAVLPRYIERWHYAKAKRKLFYWHDGEVEPDRAPGLLIIKVGARELLGLVHRGLLQSSVCYRESNTFQQDDITVIE